MSSAKAFADRAKIGIRRASSLVMPRMCRVASRPSMTGIRTSIRIAAYSPGSDSAKRSTATLPFSAQTTERFLDSRSVLRISAFRSLSSAIRIFSRLKRTSSGMAGTSKACL